MLIVLTGKKRRGKDTVAKYLVEKYGYKQHGFADKVKEYAYAYNPLIPVTGYIAVALVASIKPEYSLPPVAFYRLQTVVDAVGWEEAKEIPEVRGLLQRTGTEGGRNIFSAIAPNGTFWINLLDAELTKLYDVYADYSMDEEGTMKDVQKFQSNIVVSDGRFDNEGEWGHDRGGLIIEVQSNREGLPEDDPHASEKGISQHLIHGTLHNDGTIDELHQGIEIMLDYLGARK